MMPNLLRGRLLLSAVVAATLLAAAPSRAVARPGADLDFDEIDLPALSAALDLSDKQREAIRVARDEAKKAAVKARAEIEVASIDLRGELDKDRPDQAKVVSLIKRISELEGQARAGRIVAWLKVKQQLTAAQRQRLARAQLALGEHGRQFREQAERAREQAERAMEEARRGLEQGRREMERARREMGGDQLGLERAELEKARAELERARAEIEREMAGLHAREAAAGTSILSVDAKPSAEITVDGKVVGKSPLKLEVTAGRHVVSARWKDKTKKRTIKVKAGQNIMLELAR